ncbi:hypothetical protein JCM4814A_85670 [Streptomyces phaeofaciens JCM 4814]|uniref:Uncharacterized protein n=1 Tax=Streptomyces phaeofaciens TaxID=68254 RepID=A0A918LSV2_9ACTN|nr:hypothetical protein GCM10010226_21250 [Streptomyces phaeofaciens]
MGERLALAAASAGDVRALAELALRSERSGDHRHAEQLAQRIAECGSTETLTDLAWRRSRSDTADAERLNRQAADAAGAWGERAGELHAVDLWPHGLEPNGRRSVSW